MVAAAVNRYPGGIDTPTLYGYLGGAGAPVAHLGAQLPMGRRVRPDTIAAAALFVASDDAPYVTRISLPVDGGAMA